MKEQQVYERMFWIIDPYQVFKEQEIKLDDPNNPDINNGFHIDDENWENLIPDYLELKIERV